MQIGLKLGISEVVGRIKTREEKLEERSFCQIVALIGGKTGLFYIVIVISLYNLEPRSPYFFFKKTKVYSSKIEYYT